ncbi:MAG: hypothetical protein AB1571_00955 [Nanoarchaeota archaeon]
MDTDLIKVIPDKQKAKSMLRMAGITLEMLNLIDIEKFPSNITKEYYDVIREFISIILLLDGYKIIGEGAHKRLIEYLKQNYREFSSKDVSVMDDLRIIRNKISYDGFFIKSDYIKRKLNNIGAIINKLRIIINKKLT